MLTQYRLISTSDINLPDNHYTLNPFPDQNPDTALLVDISTYGIMHPPLLLEQKNGKFIVLSGRKRIQAASVGKKITITALVIDQAYIDQQQFIFGTLLRHQLIGSGLSCIEQAVFFQKALKVMPVEDVALFLPLLGYKKKNHIPEELISLLNLAPAAQRSLHKGSLSLRAGKKLLLLPADDQQALTNLIKGLQLGGSKQQKLIDQTFELTKRLQTNAVELLNSWQEKEKGKQHNGPQKAAALLKWLQCQCRPRSTAQEENFTKFSRQLQLPANVRLNHTLSFEDEQVTLSIDFRSREQLAEQWPQIHSLLQEQQKS